MNFILALFGYCKIPKEAVSLSMANEHLLEIVLKHASSEKNRLYLESILNGQKALTGFLRSGKLLQ